MTKTLDRTERVTIVGGREPLRYLQGGYGFAVDGRCLGRYTAQGEPIAPAKAEPAPTPAPEASAPEAASLSDLTVIELRERCKAAGIATTGLNKAALIEALEG